jgi:protein-S-isoprenylcysteine O-methyltransferase Ste14
MPVDRFYSLLFSAMWLGWIAYWWMLSGRTKSTVQRESAQSRLSYLAPLLLAVFFLFAPRLPLPILGERFVPSSMWHVSDSVGALLVLAGLLFSVWARAHLGRNWSGAVTIKEDHVLVTSGPYRFVRHPIYTGLLVALLGQAIARGEWRGVLAVGLAVHGFWLKVRIEEHWMRERFGTAYAAYSERIRALIPHVL